MMKLGLILLCVTLASSVFLKENQIGTWKFRLLIGYPGLFGLLFCAMSVLTFLWRYFP